MNTSIGFYPGFFYATGARASLPAFFVAFGEYDNWSFPFSEGRGKQAYERAYRFERLVSMGYAPKVAYTLSSVGICPTLETFEREFDETAHLSDERVEFALVDTDDVMLTGVITREEEKRLYALWLKEGDEIFMFDEVLMERWNIPALLYHFRVRAQREDENTGDWSHSHHSDNVSY